MSGFEEMAAFGAEVAEDSPNRMRKMAGIVVRKSTLDTERDGRAGTPVDTGNLLGSWSSEFSGSNANVAQGETGPTAEYADFVNSGTSRQAPNPFVWRALERNEPGFVQAVGDIGGEII